MPISPIPENEDSRLSALLECQILDTASEKIFDYVTYLATQLCDVSIAMVVFVDKDRQWFKSKAGVPEELKDIQETPRDIAFCAYTILGDDILEVPDLTEDKRFDKNPFVTDFPSIRYYAGIPLATSGGNVGTLCLLDQKTRPVLNEKQRIALKYLSDIVLTLIELRKSMAHITFLGEALDSSFNQIYFFDYETLKCIYFNEAATTQSNLKKEAMGHIYFSDIFIHDHHSLKNQLAPLIKKEKEILTIESKGRNANKEEISVELFTHIITSKSKPVLIVVANDITERKKAESLILDLNQNLESKVAERTLDAKKSLALVNATLQATTDGILVVDNSGNIINYNHRYIEFFGNDAIEANPWFQPFLKKIIAPEIFSITLSKLKIALGQKSYDELTFKDSQVYECYSQPQIVNNEITGRVWCFRDITIQKNLQSELTRQATHDSLTGIPNRLMLEDRISHAMSFTRESEGLLAIVFIDLNRFKQVNDTLSHHIGDELLKAVANRLAKLIRPSDSLARLGGDEFVILLSPIKNEDDISVICQNIQKQIAEKFLVEDQVIFITASIGVSIYPRDSQTVASLLHQADIAMFRAKELANNTFQYYTEELNIRASKTIEIENFLNMALENNELILNYQPLLDLTTGKLFGVEALIRWHHPKLGLVPPLDFIPMAETTGKILPIGNWILLTACQQLTKWHANGFPEMRMAINISAQQFVQGDFLQSIIEIINKTQVNPKYLDFELTESILLEKNDDIIQKMYDIKNLGITLVIDDFGTGYSSLKYLKDLPVGKLKIDKIFVQSVKDNKRDLAIILAILTLGKSLDIKVLAEGIENTNQINFFLENNCDEIQGFLISRPLDESACFDFFKANETHNFRDFFLSAI
jgi:diguanylate cyclase (GGDEF)-like protein/PAS domain S-box-containing protein